MAGANEINIFTDYLKQGRYLNRTLDGVSTVNSKIIAFPPGLGGTGLTTSVTPAQTIPFTIFAPYKRNKTLYSTVGTTLFENLPQPWFAIALPTPTSALKTTYEAVYEEPSIGQAIGGAVGSAGSVSGAVKAATAIFSGVGLGAATGGIPGAIVGGLAGIASANKITGTNAGTDIAAISGFQMAQSLLQAIGSSESLASLLVGQAANPYTETVFKNVGFRTHSFEYVFMPRNDAESRTVDDIIQLFKYTMLPQQSKGATIPGTNVPISGAGFFEFPYEFQITHSTQDTTFTLLPSVLSNLTVDYSGGTDSPKFFVPQMGQMQYPARVILTMQFKEMVLLTRDKLDVVNGSFYFDDPATTDPDKEEFRINKMRFRF